jgi:membrane protease YdiL (CAAX protease family)
MVKKCPQCGSESSEAAFSCEACGTAFLATEMSALAQTPLGNPTDPKSGGGSLSRDRRLELFELLLVCFIAFGGGLFLSTYILLAGRPPAETIQGNFRWWYAMSHQVGALALLWYVLRRRSQTFSDLGLYWKAKEVAIAPLLWFACGIIAYISRLIIRSFGGFPPGADPNAKAVALLFGNGVGIATVIFQFINPFFEELIVRAYLITRLRELTNSLVLAIIASVVFQVSYHLYQGFWTGLSHTGVFLVLSLYYAKTNRILAPILAHMIFDVSATFYYLLKPLH